MLLYDHRPLGAIVTDIEGTTTDIAFVKTVLFPYAEARLELCLRTIAPTTEGQSILAQVRAEVGRPTLSLDDSIAQLLTWARADQKVTPLKTLQGLIWEEGYRSGAYTSPIYADAATHLQAWHRQGVPLYVYSSGSVAAQKLLFAHTTVGDLTPCFQGYFDTTIGAKVTPDSYEKIATALALPPAEILFLSDHPGELAAAQQVGWQECAVQRPGTADFPAGQRVVQTFDQLPITAG
ncbi:MAG: acireductone synthase [Nodosilinea sp.]